MIVNDSEQLIIFFKYLKFGRCTCDKNSIRNELLSPYRLILIRGVREPENIGNSMVGTSRIPVNVEIPAGIGFPEKIEIPKNFENSATVSRTTLQYCIAA